MLDMVTVLLSALFILGVLLPATVLYFVFVGIYVMLANPLRWLFAVAWHGIESEPMETVYTATN